MYIVFPGAYDNSGDSSDRPLGLQIGRPKARVSVVVKLRDIHPASHLVLRFSGRLLRFQLQ